VTPNPPETRGPDPDPAPSAVEAASVTAAAPKPDVTAPETEIALNDTPETNSEMKKKPEGVAMAAAKIIGFLIVLTVAFLGIVFLLAKALNRQPKAELVKPKPCDDETLESLSEDALEAPQEVDAPAPPPEFSIPAPPAPAPQPLHPLPVGVPPEPEPENDKSEPVKVRSPLNLKSLAAADPAPAETTTESLSQSLGDASKGGTFTGSLEGLQGNDALGGVLSLAEGFFVFRRQALDGAQRTVSGSTMSLLMGLHRARDEGVPFASLQEDSQGGGPGAVAEPPAPPAPKVFELVEPEGGSTDPGLFKLVETDAGEPAADQPEESIPILLEDPEAEQPDMEEDAPRKENHAIFPRFN